MFAATHQSHLGTEACKKRAREILFWPGLAQGHSRCSQQMFCVQQFEESPTQRVT